LLHYVIARHLSSLHLTTGMHHSLDHQHSRCEPVHIIYDFRTIRMWNIKQGKQVRVFKGHEDAVSGVCVHGNVLHSCSWDGSIRAWDTEV